MDASEDIHQLLIQRDRAVAEKNGELFLSTQIAEIPNSGSEGYLATEKLVSESLFETQDDKDSSLVIALVKERYFSGGQFSHQAYLLYKFQEKDGVIRIIDIRW